MSLILFFSWVICNVSCILLGHSFGKKEVSRFRAIDPNASRLNHQLPVGSKVYWDEDTDHDCLRCNKGKIIKRSRFAVVPEGRGETMLQELTSICWCSSCEYRGVTLH